MTRSAAERCPGSLQLTITATGPATPCPACYQTVATVQLDGRPVLVEHRRRSDEALPMGMFA